MNRKARRSARHGKLSLEQTLASAMRLHRDGLLADAEMAYRRILQVLPQHPDACHYLGVLLHQTGRSQDAVDHIQQAIANSPDYADAYNNLGNVYKETGELAKAEQAYRKLLGFAPDHADALNNLGVVLKEKGEWDEALRTLKKAITLAPSRADYHKNIGNVYRKQDDYKQAAEAYRKSITLQPYQSDAYKNLWRVFYIDNQFDEAENVLREWLEHDPDNPVAKHYYAACGRSEAVPERASDGYVRRTFDIFASSFDAVLERLEYRAPQLVADALSQIHPLPESRLAILDAGCGTGLCGPLLRPYASRLIGVDLSSRMLAKAMGRQMYVELVEAELVGYLTQHPSAYDVVVSADTLIYFGELMPFVNAVEQALKPGGHLIFTLEKELSATDYQLNIHGRYSHSQAYVETCLAKASLQLVSINDAILRNEGGKPVLGMVVTAANIWRISECQ